MLLASKGPFTRAIFAAILIVIFCFGGYGGVDYYEGVD
jgi:amino acid transporter